MRGLVASIAKHRFLILLMVLAIIIRISYVLEYLTLPIIYGPAYDSAIYLRQAKSILVGDFGNASLVAYSPLYGYFIAIFNGGENPILLILVQVFLGCLNILLVYAIAIRLFDQKSALTSVALYIGNSLFMFYETKILAETLGLSLCLFAYFLYLLPSFASGVWSTTIFCGAFLGLATLARANILFSIPFMVIAAIVHWGRLHVVTAGGEGQFKLRLSIRLKRALGLTLGICLVLGMNGFWNKAHTGFFVPVVMVSSTVSQTTNREWDGSYQSLKGGAKSKPSPWNVVKEAEKRIQRRQAGLEEKTPSGGPLFGIDIVGWIKGAPSKLFGTFMNAEIAIHQYGYYGERSELSTLNSMPLSFGSLLLLGTVGAWGLWRLRSPSSVLPFLPFVLGVITTTTLYHPSSRYRLVMVIPLLLLAGYGLTSIRKIAGPRITPWLGCVLVLVCTYFSYRTIGYKLHSPGMWHIGIAESAIRSGDLEQARQRIERALNESPNDPRIKESITYLQSLVPKYPLLVKPGSAHRIPHYGN
jgi:hypothetical protein